MISQLRTGNTCYIEMLSTAGCTTFFSYKDLWVTVDFPTFFRVEKSTVVEGYVIFFRGFVLPLEFKCTK